MANDGKEFERLVHLIERSIGPGAALEHDVQLPVIGSLSGRTRQCDLVIRTGSKPRETITIVEVQDRSRPIEVNTFGGWLTKLDEVRAQHLICVSRHDFPESIKEAATVRGNTVRLITLKELDAEFIPLDFFSMTFEYDHFDVTEFSEASCGPKTSEIEALGIRDAYEALKSRISTINVNDRLWSLDGKEFLSMYELCKMFGNVPYGDGEGDGEISFNHDEGPALYIHVDGLFPRVALDFKFHWTRKIIRKPMSVLSYEQEDAGPLAWVVEISHDTPKGPISFKAPVVRIDEGFRMGGVQLQMPPDYSLGLFEITKITSEP
ncbi:MAG: hypothetical protein NUV50_04170 [Rhodospirillales bacterium]|nr:hypothetical protein [Rhodospirillales bacterium]